MKNTILLDEKAKNVTVIRINDTFKVCVKDMESETTYFISEKEDKLVPKDVLSISGSISMDDLVNKLIPSDTKKLQNIKSDKIFADAKLNATMLIMAGKVIMQSTYALREDLMAFETTLNLHYKYIKYSKDDKLELFEDVIPDSFSGSSVSY